MKLCCKWASGGFALTFSGEMSFTVIAFYFYHWVKCLDVPHFLSVPQAFMCSTCFNSNQSENKPWRVCLRFWTDCIPKSSTKFPDAVMCSINSIKITTHISITAYCYGHEQIPSFITHVVLVLWSPISERNSISICRCQCKCRGKTL